MRPSVTRSSTRALTKPYRSLRERRAFSSSCRYCARNEQGAEPRNPSRNPSRNPTSADSATQLHNASSSLKTSTSPPSSSDSRDGSSPRAKSTSTTGSPTYSQASSRPLRNRTHDHQSSYLAPESKHDIPPSKIGPLHHAFRPTPLNAVAPNQKRPFRLAVIGSGPAGFYSALRVMNRIEDSIVDMYEKLPVPFGLVRFGVAPDHPEVKNCIDRFTEVASSPRFNFIGNTTIGSDITLPELRPHYDAVLFAYGAAEDKMLNIPGERLPGVYSAREFVGWYNGLPEHADLQPDLQSGDTAAIIGNGNVALDVARVLLSGVDRLKGTDITEAALDKLSKSTIKNVRIIGRRGPMQASFTIKELRELIQLPNVGFAPVSSAVLPSKGTKFSLEDRGRKRIAELLAKTSADPPTGDKSWQLDFLRSPKSFVGEGRVERIKLTRNEFKEGDDPAEKNARVKVTPKPEWIRTSAVFRSIGYKSVPLDGLKDLDIEFDTRKGIFANEGGRVLSADGPLPGLYCAGWVKNGPTGVIATTMEDAFASAEAIVQDWKGKETGVYGWDMLKSQLPNHVDWQGWTNIDIFEKARGAAVGKEREKITRMQEMLEARFGSQ